jgi:hypothetical protein
VDCPQHNNCDQIMPLSITTGKIVEAYTVEQSKHIATTVKHPLTAAKRPIRLAISKQCDATEACISESGM